MTPQQIKKLVAQNKLDKAIDGIRELISESPSFLNKLVLIEGNLRDLKSAIIAQTETGAEKHIRKAKIRESILELVDSFTKNELGWLPPEVDNSPLPSPSIPDYYLPSEVAWAVKYFVPTKWQKTPPSEELELRDSLLDTTPNLLIPHLINKVFVDRQERRLDFKFFLILADSGMGKTTLMLNLFEEWRSKSRNKEMRLYHIASNKAWWEIEKIKRFGKAPDTILLLDAFDEDQKAVGNYERRLEQIIGATKDFHKIIITSRAQFFPSKKEILSETKIKTDSGFHKIRHQYIAPFDDQDIDKYLNKRFGSNWAFWNRKRKQEAKNIVDKAPNLMVRPMLLAYIDDLLDSRRAYDYSYQVYEEMVSKWIEREAARVEIGRRENFSENLRRFSVELAVHLYKKRIGGEHVIHHDNLELFAERNSIDLSKIEMQSRSLLDRNADGFYKFSHKSVLEYFLATRYIQDLSFALGFNFDEMRQAKTFHGEMIECLFVQGDFDDKFIFVRADLSGTNLSKNVFLDKGAFTNFHRANFSAASLRQLNLSSAKLAGAKFMGADLREALLIKASLEGADLRKANLSGADLGKANLLAANLFLSLLQGANLQQANLKFTNMVGTNLPLANLEGAHLEGANLLGADLRGAKLLGADLKRCCLMLTNLEGAIMKNCNLRQANLSEAFLLGADLEKVNLRGATLIGTNLKETCLKEASLWKANFRKADLRGADLQHCSLKDAYLWHAELSGADLSNTTLNELQYAYAKEQGAILTNARIVKY